MRDVGKRKSYILKEKIEEEFSDACVKVYNVFVKENDDLLEDILKIQKVDFIVNATDSPKNINEIVLSKSLKYKIPFINGSVGIDSANWGPILIGTNNEMKKNLTQFSQRLEGSISSTNMILGSFVANDILEYFIDPTQEILYKKKILNFRNYTVEVI